MNQPIFILSATLLSGMAWSAPLHPAPFPPATAILSSATRLNVIFSTKDPKSIRSSSPSKTRPLTLAVNCAPRCSVGNDNPRSPLFLHHLFHRRSDSPVKDRRDRGPEMDACRNQGNEFCCYAIQKTHTYGAGRFPLLIITRSRPNTPTNPPSSWPGRRRNSWGWFSSLSVTPCPSPGWECMSGWVCSPTGWPLPPVFLRSLG